MCLQGHSILLNRGPVVVVQSCLTGGIVFGRGWNIFGRLELFYEGWNCQYELRRTAFQKDWIDTSGVERCYTS